MIEKKLTTLSVAAAMIGAVSLATTVAPSGAYAVEKVKCFGISKAAENDCANAAGTHSCAGQSTISFSGDDWKLAPSAEECLTEGGMLQMFEGFNTQKS